MSKSLSGVRTVGNGIVELNGAFLPKGTGSPVVTEGTKFFTVARTSAGLYTLTLRDKWQALVSAKAGVRVADATPTVAQFGDYVAASKTLQLRILQGGAGAGRTKHIQLPLFGAREVGASYAPVNAAGNGGVLASDTTPALANLTASKEIGATWAATNVDEIAWNLTTPPDFNEAAAMTFKARAKKTGTTDTVALTVAAYFGVNGTDAGGNTGNLTTSISTLTKALTIGSQTAYPSSLMIGLKPGTHANDSVELASAWLEYTSTEAPSDFALADLAADADNVITFTLTMRNSTTA